MPFRPIQTISGFTEYGVTEVWAIHYENKRERASSTERKVVFLCSHNGVTSRATIMPLAYYSSMSIQMCSVPGLSLIHI